MIIISDHALIKTTKLQNEYRSSLDTKKFSTCSRNLKYHVKINVTTWCCAGLLGGIKDLSKKLILISL